MAATLLTSGVAGTGSAVSTLSRSTSTDASTNRAIVAIVMFNGSSLPSITAVSYTAGGTSASAFALVGSRTGTNSAGFIYASTNPDASATVTVKVDLSGNLSAGSQDMSLHLFSLYDIDQTTPCDGFVSGTGVNTLAVTSATNNYTLCGAASPSGAIASWTSGTAAHEYINFGFANTAQQAGAATCTFTWNTSTNATGVACNIYASGAAPSGGQPAMRRFGGVPGMTPGPQSFGRRW